jgi:hypothetical protein
MSKQLMEIVLPRLARPLYRHLEKYRTGELSDRQFTRKFEALLRKQHAWLAERGVSAARAALALHAGVLVLSMPGLRAEAAEANIPLEIIEYRAIREAAADVSKNYDLEEGKLVDVIAGIVSRYAE